MKRQLMAEQWNKFSRRVLAKEAPTVQRMEMRRAFYAGAQAILFRVIAAVSPDSEPTEADLQMMQGILNELQDFAKEVEAGIS